MGVHVLWEAVQSEDQYFWTHRGVPHGNTRVHLRDMYQALQNPKRLESTQTSLPQSEQFWICLKPMTCKLQLEIKVLKVLFRACFPSRLWFHQDQRGHIHVQYMWVHLWQPQAENAVSPRGQTHSEPWLSMSQLWKDMSDQKRPSSSQI